MNFVEKFIKQGEKPSGVFGRLLGRLMNMGHRDMYRWGVEHVSIEPDAIILDIGCGGGKAVQFLAKHVPNGKVYGIDHSPDMVKLARNVNQTLIKDDRVEISHGSVSSLPFSNERFTLVTAFETIQFWPNLSEDLKEIKRVLKPSGKLLIVNRHPKQDSKWAEFLQLHTPEAYRNVLDKAGFIDIVIDENSKVNWLGVLAINHKHKKEEV